MTSSSNILINRSFVVLIVLTVAFGNSWSQTNYYVGPSGTDAPAPGNGLSAGTPWRTITYAVSQASAGSLINVASGVYNEPTQVTVNKALAISGIDSSVVVSPVSGSGFSITSNNVTLQNIQVRASQGNGIIASSVSNLTLTNVYCLRNYGSGAQLTNLSGVIVTGGSYSYNGKHGFNTTGGSNYTISNVSADSNGWTLNGSGLCLVGITGSSQASNLTIRYNRIHGLVIGDGAAGITVNGGTFRSNGKDRGYNGGGILLYADVAPDSNIAIEGNILADSNATAGIWLNAQSSSYVIKNIQIGQSGTSIFTNNGGAAIIVFGNSKNVTITGDFYLSTASSAAGVISVGTNSLGDYSPTNVSINNSYFNGYTSSNPAITLDDGVFHVSNQPVLANTNTFAGATGQSAIESIIHDSLDNNSLGRVYHTNDNPLPVELESCDAEVSGDDVMVRWTTASELNNYGFEIQRSAIYDQRSVVAPWQNIGFVRGAGTSFVPRSYSFVDRSVLQGTHAYRLKQIDQDGSSSFSENILVDVENVTKEMLLRQNYPNPFNPNTSIEFAVPATARTIVSVFNMLGQRLAVLFDDVAEGGNRYQVQFDATKIPSGLYFYRLESGTTRIVKRMIVLK